MRTDPALRRLVLGTVLGSFAGPTAPAWATGLLADGLAGYLLFGGNVRSPGQVEELAAELRARRPRVLLGIDEEGGDVTRLEHHTGSGYPGNAALGAVDDPELTRRVYREIGGDLARLGLNLNLAPVVDVNTADDNPVIGTRSFGADPHRVAAHSAAAVAGLAAAGVAACAKHFPGHGATHRDSHLELPLVDASVAVLRRRDLPPFAAVVAAGVPAVMTAHIRIPALTGDAPATFSRAAVTDLLRGELGFTGAVVTDALEMAGAAGPAGGVPAAAVAALRAGCDLLCLGARVDAALIGLVADEIVAAVGDGALPLTRLEDAAARVATLEDAATRVAALDDAAAGNAATGNAADEGAGGRQLDRGLGYRAALAAVRVEGSPRVAGAGGVLAVRLESAASIASGRVPWGLGPHLPDGAELRLIAADADPAALCREAAGRPVIFVGRNLHRLPGAPSLIEEVARQSDVTVVEMGWPSAWRPAGVRAFVTCHGASTVSSHAVAEVLGLLA